MNGEPITPEEREKIRSLRENGMSVNTIAYITGRSGRTVRRISDDVASPLDCNAHSNDAIRFIQQNWHWVVPKRKPPKKPVRRGLTTPYYYPRLWDQLPEEDRPWWYHED